MSTETQQQAQLHGGRLVARRLKAHGVTKLFTLSGGHLFSIYDGCREEGIDIVDVRHESAAAFAAEGWAKVTREPGVARADRRPGRDQRDERDGLGAAEPLADARARRPRARVALGPGLAAGDRPRAVRAPAGQARRHGRDAPPRSRGWSTRRWSRRSRPHSGPTFVDFPLDHVFMEAEEPRVRRRAARALEGRRGRRRRDRARRRAAARRRAPGDHGRHQPLLGPRRGGAARARRGAAGSRSSSTAWRRGCLPADHELFFSRARSAGLKGADVALVIGVPMDFRLGFGGSLRRGDRDRRDRRRRAGARAPARGGRRALRRAAGDARARSRGRGRRRRTRRPGSRTCARPRPRSARPRSERARPTTARRCTRCACTRELARRARPQRDRDRRRRRLRLLRRPRHRHLRAGLLARPGAVRLPGLRARLRARGQARPPRPPGRAAARRRRVRLLAGWSATRWPATA